MPAPVIIGIAGPARVGKDTAARFVEAAVGGYIYPLAKPMKAMIKAGFGIDLYDPYWAGRKEDVIPAIGKSPRQLMQTLGTEWGRQLISPELWLVLAAAQLIQRGPGMIIPDIRFENEAAWVRERGGTILHLRRKHLEPVHQHESETGIKAIPGEVTIDNDATLVDLQIQIEELAGAWRE